MFGYYYLRLAHEYASRPVHEQYILECEPKIITQWLHSCAGRIYEDPRFVALSVEIMVGLCLNFLIVPYVAFLAFLLFPLAFIDFVHSGPIEIREPGGNCTLKSLGKSKTVQRENCG